MGYFLKHPKFPGNSRGRHDSNLLNVISQKNKARLRANNAMLLGLVHDITAAVLHVRQSETVD